MAFYLSPQREQELRALVARYPNKRAACIPALHLCQEQVGWVSPEVVDFVAQRLELSTAAVEGVVTFYTSLFQEPVAPQVVWVCRTLSCELRGARQLQQHLEERFGCKANGHSRDGKFSLRTAECLAACGGAPVVQINQRYYENLDAAQLEVILDGIVAANDDDEVTENVSERLIRRP